MSDGGMTECRYYQQVEDGAVVCQLCPHRCRIADGKTGRCRSRRNHHGVLVSEVYGKPCALAIDPIEKKPLYHFHPVQFPLPELSESRYLTGLTCRCRLLRPLAGSRCRPLQETSLPRHCLYLHRAAHLYRIHHRYGPAGARSRTVEHPCHSWLCQPGAAGRPSSFS